MIEAAGMEDLFGCREDAEGVSGICVFAGININFVRLPSAAGPLVVRLDSSSTVAVVACRTGSCRVFFKDERVHFGAGDSFIVHAVHDSDNDSGAHLEFSGGFIGTAVIVDTQRFTMQTCDILRSFGVDVHLLETVLHGIDGCIQIADLLQVSHVLLEIGSLTTNDAEIGYYRLKTIELLRAFESVPGVIANRSGRQARLSHDDIARAAQHVMVSNLDKRKTIPEIASECGVSPTLMKQAFHEVFGVSIYQWYRIYRIHSAAEILMSDDQISVSQAALSVGYSNPSKFAKAFRDVMGVGPSEWRIGAKSV